MSARPFKTIFPTSPDLCYASKALDKWCPFLFFPPEIMAAILEPTVEAIFSTNKMNGTALKLFLYIKLLQSLITMKPFCRHLYTVSI